MLRKLRLRFSIYNSLSCCIFRAFKYQRELEDKLRKVAGEFDKTCRELGELQRKYSDLSDRNEATHRRLDDVLEDEANAQTDLSKAQDEIARLNQLLSGVKEGV